MKKDKLNPEERAEEIISLFNTFSAYWWFKVKLARIYQTTRVNVLAEYGLVSEYEQLVLLELEKL